MFTGIVECLGKVENVSKRSNSLVIYINVGDMDNIKEGESIAINGVCLTTVRINGYVLTFDVSTETLSRTSLKDIKASDKVNIERALKVGDRLGGHFVTGHIDGTGIIERKEDTPGQTKVWIKVDEKLSSMMIEKGSVAVDGISLTLVNITGCLFSVALIPYTLSMTTLGFKDVGAAVNIEVDMIGKWVKQILLTEYGKTKAITEELLRGQGF